MAQKYVIVHFVEKAKVPNEFRASEWPLHITLLANFTIAQPIEGLENELANYALQLNPFDVVTDGEAVFGPNKNVAVSLIRPDKSILEVHHMLAAITARLGATYDEPAFMNGGYRPHATIQRSTRLSDGQKVALNDFTLVDMWPNEDINRRKIIKTFRFGKD